MSRIGSLLLLSVLTLVFATLLIVATRLGSLVWLRTAIGIPFLLVLPGMAAMLFVDSERRLGRFEWFTLSISTSIAVVTLVALGQAATIGLNAIGTLVGVTGFTVAALMAALLRILPQASRRPVHERQDAGRMLAISAAGLLACAVFVLALSLPVLAAGPSAGIVELWALPDSHTGSISIGARNVDATPTRYELVITQGTKTIADTPLTLAPGQTHVFAVQAAAIPTTASPVAASLTDPSGRVRERLVSVWSDRR